MSKKQKGNHTHSKKSLLALGRKFPPLVEDLIKFGQKYQGTPGICRSLTPVMPPAVRVVLSYGFNVSWTTSAGEVDTYVFAGNGPFDPDVTGAGSQPLGFDQWHALFRRHRVIASSIEFDLTTPDAATNDAQVMEGSVVPLNQNVGPSSMAAARACTYCVAKAFTGTFNLGTPRYKNSMSTAELIGEPESAVLIEDSLSGTVSANANDLWYWFINTQPTDQASATVVRCVGTIHYLMDFYERDLSALSAAADASSRSKGKGKTPKK